MQLTNHRTCYLATSQADNGLQISWWDDLQWSNPVNTPQSHPHLYPLNHQNHYTLRKKTPTWNIHSSSKEIQLSKSCISFGTWQNGIFGQSCECIYHSHIACKNILLTLILYSFQDRSFFSECKKKLSDCLPRSLRNLTSGIAWANEVLTLGLVSLWKWDTTSTSHQKNSARVKSYPSWGEGKIWERGYFCWLVQVAVSISMPCMGNTPWKCQDLLYSSLNLGTMQTFKF